MSKEKRPRKGKYRGQNARANTLLSINKTPNYTSSLHQISGFSRPRAALCFLSSRAALYFTKTAEDDDKTTTEEERGSPVCPVNRARARENIFFLFGCFLSSFCLLFAPARYFHSREDIFFLFEHRREAKNSRLSPLPFFCPVQVSLSRALELFFENKKIQKNEKRASREREKTKIIALPHNNLFDISLFLLRATMETMNTTTNNKREGDEKDEDEEDKKRTKKDELEEDESETQETHPWSANEEILEEEVYVQDLGKVSDDVKVVEAEKRSWNRKPLARPIDGQTDSIRTF